jgi:hypothetical protein
LVRKEPGRIPEYRPEAIFFALRAHCGRGRPRSQIRRVRASSKMYRPSQKAIF